VHSSTSAHHDSVHALAAGTTITSRVVDVLPAPATTPAAPTVMSVALLCASYSQSNVYKMMTNLASTSPAMAQVTGLGSLTFDKGSFALGALTGYQLVVTATNKVSRRAEGLAGGWEAW